jgi:hypothetical protein
MIELVVTLAVAATATACWYAVVRRRRAEAVHQRAEAHEEAVLCSVHFYIGGCPATLARGVDVQVVRVDVAHLVQSVVRCVRSDEAQPRMRTMDTSFDAAFDHETGDAQPFALWDAPLRAAFLSLAAQPDVTDVSLEGATLTVRRGADDAPGLAAVVRDVRRIVDRLHGPTHLANRLERALEVESNPTIAGRILLVLKTEYGHTAAGRRAEAELARRPPAALSILEEAGRLSVE